MTDSAVDSDVVIYRIVLYSPAYFAACVVGGALSCGVTHTAMTPIDLVKCNKQANSDLFNRSVIASLRSLYSGTLAPVGFGGGISALFRGWGPTLAGYSIQGAFKFGLYEYFKHKLIIRMNIDKSIRYPDLIYIGSSAMAEFVADIALCPFEAVKVRIQTNPTFAKGVIDGLPRMIRDEGLSGLYVGIVPLWLRQVPYTVIKFLSFERIASALYYYSPITKDDMSKSQQLGIVFTSGYVAGVLCGAISHPADVIVSHMYKDGRVERAEQRWRLLDSTRNIIRDCGWRGLWAGFGPRVFMIGTLTGLQWLIYGSFKAAVNLPTPGEAILVVEKKEKVH